MITFDVFILNDLFFKSHFSETSCASKEDTDPTSGGRGGRRMGHGGRMGGGGVRVWGRERSDLKHQKYFILRMGMEGVWGWGVGERSDLRHRECGSAWPTKKLCFTIFPCFQHQKTWPAANKTDGQNFSSGCVAKVAKSVAFCESRKAEIMIGWKLSELAFSGHWDTLRAWV